MPRLRKATASRQRGSSPLPPSHSSASPPRGWSPPPSPSPLPPRASLEFIQHVPTLKRIPKGARQLCMAKFCTIIDEIVNSNSVAAWVRLLHFPTRCLRVPTRDGGRSLASRVKSLIQSVTIQGQEQVEWSSTDGGRHVGELR